MVILLSKKQKILNIIYFMVSIGLFISAAYINATSFSWNNQKTYTKFYESWVMLMRTIPFLSMSCAMLLSAIGKRIFSFIATLVQIGFAIITIVSSMRLNLEIGTYISAFFNIVLLIVAVLQLITKSSDYEVKFTLTKRETILNISFTLSILVSYFFMKGFWSVNFFPYFNDVDNWNFLGTFSKTVKTGNVFEIVIMILILLSIFLWWYKKSTVAFCVSMVYALAFLIAFFINIDYPYRTVSFNILSLFAFITIALSIVMFKSSLTVAGVGAEEKLYKLELMLQNKVISEDEYNKRVQKIKDKMNK